MPPVLLARESAMINALLALEIQFYKMASASVKITIMF